MPFRPESAKAREVPSGSWQSAHAISRGTVTKRGLAFAAGRIPAITACRARCRRSSVDIRNTCTSGAPLTPRPGTQMWTSGVAGLFWRHPPCARIQRFGKTTRSIQAVKHAGCTTTERPAKLSANAWSSLSRARHTAQTSLTRATLVICVRAEAGNSPARTPNSASLRRRVKVILRAARKLHASECRARGVRRASSYP